MASLFEGTQLGSLVNSLEMVIKAMAMDEIPGSEAIEKKGGLHQDSNNAAILETFYFAKTYRFCRGSTERSHVPSCNAAIFKGFIKASS